MGAPGAQLVSPTCGSVVEVLVDELHGGLLAVALSAALRRPKHTSLDALAMSLNAGGGNLGTIFSTLTYSVMMAGCVGNVW